MAKLREGLPRATVSVSEAAKILGLGKTSTYKACHTGEIPCVRIGNQLLIPLVQLYRLLSGNSEEQKE